MVFLKSSKIWKKANKKILNTCYLHENTLVSGPVERIKNINIIAADQMALDYEKSIKNAEEQINKIS